LLLAFGIMGGCGCGPRTLSLLGVQSPRQIKLSKGQKAKGNKQQAPIFQQERSIDEARMQEGASSGG
jgi:hypothetical protein